MNTAQKAALVVATAGMAAGASAGTAFAGPGFDGGAGAHGIAKNSPGLISGNVVQVPIGVPINLCGNTVNIVGLLNPAFGNTCVNS